MLSTLQWLLANNCCGNIRIDSDAPHCYQRTMTSLLCALIQDHRTDKDRNCVLEYSSLHTHFHSLSHSHNSLSSHVRYILRSGSPHNALHYSSNCQLHVQVHSFFCPHKPPFGPDPQTNQPTMTP